MFSNRRFTLFLLTIFATLFLTACFHDDDDGSSVCNPPAGDYAGYWTVSGSDAGNCGDEGSWSGSATIAVSGNTMTGFPTGSNQSHSGTICGNKLTVSTSYPEDGGTTALQFTATFTSNSQVNGSGTWQWSDGSDSCNGTTTFTGTKN